jgi:hypothetical protein
MEFLILVILVLAFWVWHLMSTRHDGSIKCPKCKAINVGTKSPCWKCQYEFEKRPLETEELKTCPKCKTQYYASPDWDHKECYKCMGIFP